MKGIILAPVIVGAFLAIIYYHTYKSNKFELLALYAYFSVYNNVSVDFSSFVYPWSTYIQPTAVILIILFLSLRVKKEKLT